jgi:integrase
MSRLLEWEIIENNPAHNIKNLATTETRKYIPFTHEEKARIREYFFLNHYRYYVILMLIYHAGIRPKEVLALKIKDIDLRNRIITILPDIELENSKTKTIREIPINNELLPFLRELQLEKYPRDYFVFGSPGEKGAGNRGCGKTKGGHGGVYMPGYFMPSRVMIKRDTVTKFWKAIVIDKLKINKYLYAAKHTGCDDKLLSGISLDSLKNLYGHSSKYMTEKYASVLQRLHFKEIQENSPAF